MVSAFCMFDRHDIMRGFGLFCHFAFRWIAIEDVVEVIVC